tara:strand:- start:868 stop:2016 length:1149 start_codon:yes stop_codon:yes gene_type:complete
MEVKENVEIIIENGTILDIGRKLSNTTKAIDCNHMLVSPGFVDSHTHPVFLDARENEFKMRIAGLSYEEISKSGGGIINSVNGVRNADELDLIRRVTKRMDKFIQHGTTTVECKSGYGLNTESELKSLKVIHEVNKVHNIDMIATFMGGHAFPNEFQKNKSDYVDLICNEMIPEVANQGIAVFNDVFCENGYFNNEQTLKILNRGKEYGLVPRMHADEFQDSNSAKIAAEVRAVSADHLMAVNDNGIKMLSENNIIATLLPGTTFFLGKTKYAPYLKLKDAGVEVALATDYNPGSCNIQSMPFIISLACIYLKMSVVDAIKAATYTPARSLMIDKEVGSIEIDKKADIIIWNISNMDMIPYTITENRTINNVLKNGIPTFTP